MTRRAILAGALTGMTALGVAGPVFAGAVFADPVSPSPSGSPSTPSTSPPPPPPPSPRTDLEVTIAPYKAEPGDTVNIKAVAHEDLHLDNKATVESPVLQNYYLTASGKILTGTAQVMDHAEAGIYPVQVGAVTNGVKLTGTAQITVVVFGDRASPTPTVPRGGVGTGGGGAAGHVDLTMIGAGSAIALLGMTAAVAAARRRRTGAGQ